MPNSTQNQWDPFLKTTISSKPYPVSSGKFTISRKSDWGHGRGRCRLAERGERGWCSCYNAVWAKVHTVWENRRVQCRGVLNQAKLRAVGMYRALVLFFLLIFFIQVSWKSRFIVFLDKRINTRECESMWISKTDFFFNNLLSRSTLLCSILIDRSIIKSSNLTIVNMINLWPLTILN